MVAGIGVNVVKGEHELSAREKGLDIKADGCVLLGTISWNVQIMNRYGKILVVLITVAITPLATAEIYKCDGPDGPISWTDTRSERGEQTLVLKLRSEFCHCLCLLFLAAPPLFVCVCVCVMEWGL